MKTKIKKLLLSPLLISGPLLAMAIAMFAGVTLYGVFSLGERSAEGAVVQLETLTDLTATTAITDKLFVQTAGSTIGYTTAGDVLDLIPSSDYGDIYVTGGATPQNFTTSATKLNGFTADGPTGGGLTVAHGTDTITPSVTGNYTVSLCPSFSGDSGATFRCCARVNAIESNVCFVRKMGTPTGDIGSACMHGLIALTAADVLTVYCESATVGGKDMTMVEGHLLVEQKK